MTIYTPKRESITGADLTGSDGSTDRSYVLANASATLSQMQIIVAQAILQPLVDFTFASATDTVTFTNAVWDDQIITLDYFVTSASPTTSVDTTTLQVARLSGLGKEVQFEELGTGDGAEKSYDLENINIIADSYTVYWADATGNDTNDFTALVDDTDYSINKDGGTLLLTSAGVTAVNGKKIYISYTYSLEQSDTVLSTYIPLAKKEIEKLTGNYWGAEKSTVQYFDGYQSDYPQTDEPYGTQIQPYPEFELKYQGVNSITSVLFLDREGNTDTTLETTQYRLVTDDDGNDGRVLINTSIPNGKMNVKITYAHGYATVPILVQEAEALIAGVRALINISGGSYVDLSTYTLPEGSFSLGQIYVNIREAIVQVKARVQEIVDSLGYRYSCA